MLLPCLGFAHIVRWATDVRGDVAMSVFYLPYLLLGLAGGLTLLGDGLSVVFWRRARRVSPPPLSGWLAVPIRVIAIAYLAGAAAGLVGFVHEAVARDPWLVVTVLPILCYAVPAGLLFCWPRLLVGWCVGGPLLGYLVAAAVAHLGWDVEEALFLVRALAISLVPLGFAVGSTAGLLAGWSWLRRAARAKKDSAGGPAHVEVAPERAP